MLVGIRSDISTPARIVFVCCKLRSLSIEEQDYIVWPALLLLVARLRASRLAIVADLAFGVCPIPSSDVELAFYSPVARTWELLAGSLLAFIQQDIFGGATSNQSLSRFKSPHCPSASRLHPLSLQKGFISSTSSSGSPRQIKWTSRDRRSSLATAIGQLRPLRSQC
jgi:hypothetical protein